MESIRLDGSDRRLLLTAVGHAYGVAVLHGVVYWTDWTSESVWSANITHTDDAAAAGTGVRHLVVDKLAGLMDLHAISVVDRPSPKRTLAALHRR